MTRRPKTLAWDRRHLIDALFILALAACPVLLFLSANWALERLLFAGLKGTAHGRHHRGH